MSLEFAIDRLYEVGWTPAEDLESERLPDGRRVPTVSCVQREFDRAGLRLSIAHAPEFRCYRASWDSEDAKELQAHGTVIGLTEREAAVFALAQLQDARRQSESQAASTV